MAATGRDWTPAQEAILKNHDGKAVNMYLLAKLIGMPRTSCRARAKELGVVFLTGGTPGENKAESLALLRESGMSEAEQRRRARGRQLGGHGRYAQSDEIEGHALIREGWTHASLDALCVDCPDWFEARGKYSVRLTPAGRTALRGS